MSQVLSSHMGRNSSPTCSLPSETNGNHPWGYGGTIPEHLSDRRYFHNSVGKKSNLRLNDQLIPKPTDINIAKKMSEVATPKEHPYSSHISRFAVFPSFRSPDDPETGVRAASQPFPNLHVPNGAPEVILQSKSIGGPYRYEVLETPVRGRQKAVSWTGDHGFMSHTKPLRGEKQVFYPTPPKTVLPNPKLRDWDLSLSERTSNMLRNLERTHWLTSYQMHYTGSGPANPLKMDDFQEKMSNLPGINPHTAALLERSHPVFVPSKPNRGCRRSRGSPARGSTRSPAPDLRETDPARNRSAALNPPQELPSAHNEVPHADQMCLSQSESSAGLAGAEPTDLSPGIIRKQDPERGGPACEGRQRKVQFDESLVRKSVSPNCQEAQAAQTSRTEQHLSLPGRPHSRGGGEQSGENESRCSQFTPAKEKANIASGDEFLSAEQGGGELLRAAFGPCVLKRPPVLPGIRSTGGVGILGQAGAGVGLLDLKNSFSKSEAHRRFNSSITRAAVNLRDNVMSGKKHNFYGINCNHIHG